MAAEPLTLRQALLESRSGYLLKTVTRQSLIRFLSPKRIFSKSENKSMIRLGRTAKRVNSTKLLTIRSIVDKLWVWLGGGHTIAPSKIGDGDHDCALASLYWAAPQIPEDQIVEAFGFCAEHWPYGGVTNKEFQIALKYLKAKSRYCANEETLGDLLDRKPGRCVALLPYHFIAIINGKIVGRDTHLAWGRDTRVYCHWLFHSRRS